MKFQNNHNNQNHHESLIEKIKVYQPLIIIIGLIAIFTFVRQYLYGMNLEAMLNDCMGVTFLVFGGIKLLRWQGFVDAFRSYDDVAQKLYGYAVAYPFFEITLGLLYWFRAVPVFTNVVTICLTSLTTYSVIKELRKQNPFPCACLGVVFKLPMTWVTLAENSFVIVVALFLLARNV
jgi:hypothetical protein